MANGTNSTNNISFDDLLLEIKKNRTEIKNAIEASETRLLLTIEDLRNKNVELERENNNLKKEIELIRRNEKKNSIIIFGLENKKEDLEIERVCNSLQTLVDIKIDPSEINNFYTLGRTESSPLKIDFVSYWKKSLILRNCYKLKGKKISISPDYTPLQREEIKILKKHLALAKLDNQEGCYIKNNKLIVNNITYTVEELIQKEEFTEKRKANSAPQTPTIETLPDKTVQEPNPRDKEKQEPRCEGAIITTPNSSYRISKPLTRLQDNKIRKNSAPKK